MSEDLGIGSERQNNSYNLSGNKKSNLKPEAEFESVSANAVGGGGAGVDHAWAEYDTLNPRWTCFIYRSVVVLVFLIPSPLSASL